ncbi:MAG: hypothetical protein PUB17_08080 [Lachnospiraceae bacterium]|nr:hypothetical protein [Lachnospiraceae bacterium]
MSISINVNRSVTEFDQERTDSFAVGNARKISETDMKIAAKRKSAGAQAMKLISDAWDKDKDSIKGINELKEHIKQNQEDIKDLSGKLDYISTEKDAIREKYGIDPESEEYKDLELLEKYQNNTVGVANDSFTKEEIDRLKELQNMPLTDYQKEVLKLNLTSCQISRKIEEKENSSAGDTMAITDSEIERLKSRDMIKATAAADDIMAAASKDIIGMLVEESKEHVDDKLEEEQDKSEESQKKEEEQKELIDKAKERKEEAEQQTEAIRDAKDSQEEVLDGVNKTDTLELESNIKKKSVDHVEEAQKQINKIIKDNNLINEDLKGIEIDFNF